MLQKSGTRQRFSMYLVLVWASLACVAEPPTSSLRYQLESNDRAPSTLTGEFRLAQISWGSVLDLTIGTLQEGVLNFDPFGLQKFVVVSGEKLVPYIHLRDERVYVGTDVAAEFMSQKDTTARFGLLLAAIAQAVPKDEGTCYQLPEYIARTLTLITPDGRPAPPTDVSVTLLLTRNNHCGYPQGWEIAQGVSGQDGRFRFTAPPGRVWVGCNARIADNAPDSNGAPLQFVTGFELPVQDQMTVSAIWEAEQAFQIRLKSIRDLPSADVTFRVEFTYNANACGALTSQDVLARKGARLSGSAELACTSGMTLTALSDGPKAPLRRVLIPSEIATLRKGKLLKLDWAPFAE